MRILLLGAGGPAGVNALRALHAAGHELLAGDDNPAHLVWCEPYARTISGEEVDFDEIDLVLAQPDPIVLWLSEQRYLPKFLPPKATIEACQDKMRTAVVWKRASLREHAPIGEVSESIPDYLHLAADAFGLPFWLRARRGAGARAAIAAHSIEQGFHWVRFWQTRIPDIEFMAEQYLPGRDLAWSSVWCRGELVTSFARERLEYLYPHLTPEGLTGTPTIARVVHDGVVTGVAQRAVTAVDPEPHGIFCVDLREDEMGYPRPTEINAGRGFTTLGLWSLYETNFLDVAVQCALGKRPYGVPRYNALPDGLTLSRHVDCPHVFTQALVPA